MIFKLIGKIVIYIPHSNNAKVLLVLKTNERGIHEGKEKN